MRSYPARLFAAVLALFLLFSGCLLIYQNNREKKYRIDRTENLLQNINLHLYDLIDFRHDSLYENNDHESLQRYIDTFHVDSLSLSFFSPEGEVLFQSRDTLRALLRISTLEKPLHRIRFTALTTSLITKEKMFSLQ